MLKRSPTAVEDQHWYLFLSLVVLYLPINPMSISTDWEIAVGGRRHPALNCLDLWSKIKLEPVFCLQVPPCTHTLVLLIQFIQIGGAAFKRHRHKDRF